MRLKLFFLLAMVVQVTTHVAARTTADEVARDSIMALADPLSPCHNEEELVVMLTQELANEKISHADRSWCEALLEMAMKNRVGEVCADLEYVTADGEAGHLHGLDRELTLIFFNDPDCLSCHRVKERLDTCDALRDMVSRHELTVLALCVGDDEALWRAEDYPDYVVNAVDAARAVENDEVYELPTMPLFYLLDGEKRIMLKNEPSLNRVLEVLSNLRDLH